jgi:type IV fimbrial biogenesis protein FimT
MNTTHTFSHHRGIGADSAVCACPARHSRGRAGGAATGGKGRPSVGILPPSVCDNLTTLGKRVFNFGMNTNRGFTIPELMLVLAIAGVMAALAVPNFNSLLVNNRMTAQVNNMVGVLNLARSEAVRRGLPVTVCTSTNQTSCNGGATWETGLIAQAGGTVIRVVEGFPNNFTLRSGQFVNSVTFQPNAFTNQSGTFRFCDQRGQSAARGVLLSVTGRPQISQDTNANGIHNDHAGADLTCP